MPLLRAETELQPDDLFSLPSDAHPWVVAHVRSRHEKTLARHLVRHRVPFYLPLATTERIRGGRRFRSHLPVFPGYVFLRLAAPERDAVWTSGAAVSLLDVEDQQRLGEELWQIRRLQLAGAAFRPLEQVVPGNVVRVKDGAFAGYNGRVLRERGRERLVVDISLLRRSVVVEFERAHLELAARG